MKTLIPIALVIVLLSSFSITSVVAQDSDLLGVFFDETGNKTTIDTTEPLQIVSVYLILLDPSHVEGVHSWECILETRSDDGPAPLFGWELSGEAINVDQPPRFFVSLATPLPPAATVVLASAGAYVADPQTEILFYLHPYDPPSLENPPGSGYYVTTPLYGYGQGDEDYQSLGWTSGCEAAPVARINDDGEYPAWSLDELPEEILFGYVPAGETAIRNILLENTGEVALSGQLDVSGDGFLYRYGQLIWNEKPQWFRIEPGEQMWVTLLVQSAMDEEYIGELAITICGESTAIDLVKGEYIPSCIVEPAVIDFGEVDLHDPNPATRHATITNVGTGDLWIMVDEDCLDFGTFVLWPFGLPPLLPGQYCYLSVGFHPSDLGPQTCVISLGDEACEDVVCAGVAVDGPPQCVITPGNWNFEAIVIRDAVQRTFEIRNAGGELLEGQVAIPASCSYFTIIDGAEPFALGHDQIHIFTVEFKPLEAGFHTCSVFVSPDCDDVYLSGTAIALTVSCSVEPDLIEFGDVGIGYSVQRDVVISNNGTTHLTGILELDGLGETISAAYTLEGAGPFTLAPGEDQPFSIRFAPQIKSQFSALVTTSLPECSMVGISGTGIAIPESCSVEPDFIDFGTVWIGYARQRYFTISNRSTEYLTGDLRLDGFGESVPTSFVLEDAGPFTLAPGNDWNSIVRFAPPDTGRFTALITTGLSGCSSVPLIARGIEFHGCWHYENGDAPIVGSVYFPGPALGVAVAGSYAFVASVVDPAGFLQVIDISVPESPAIVGAVDTPSWATGVAVAGNYAYVAAALAGLQVIDITDLENPYIVGSVDTPGIAWGVAVSGDYAYVADEDGLQVIDISVPESPAIVGAVDTQDDAHDVTVAGNYAYVADGGSGLQVIDITDPENPYIVGSVDTPGIAWGVAVSGDYAYVADGQFGLQVIDISVPESPVIVGAVGTPGWAGGVAVAGNYAYVADVWSGLQVIDISVPESPVIVGAVGTPDDAQGVAVVGNYAYVANGNEYGEYGSLQVAWRQCDDSVAIEDDSEETTPDGEVPTAGLHLAVHPNPFNPQTTITFSLERDEWASVGVYDLTGLRVTTLADRQFAAGSHTLNWDGRDSAGRAMPSGTYIVRLETDSGVEARKVMLVR